MVQLLRGDLIADELCADLAAQIQARQSAGLPTPGLAVVLVGNHAPSEIYVKSKLERSHQVGIRSFEHRLPESTTQAELLALIAALNHDPAVHGILVQLPLPAHIAPDCVLDAIDPAKDVDGFHPINFGRLSTGGHGLVPCTPLGCMILLERVITDFRGLDAVVIGKSNNVGKPAALLLMERDCTVTVTHIFTRNLPEITRKADIIVAAAGSPGLVKGDWIKPGAVIIDVGINRITTPDGKKRVVGDVAAKEMDHARILTPVPRGVGPMTVACLLLNTVKACTSLTG